MARKTRYLIRNYRDQMFVGGLSAKSSSEADEVASKDYGPGHHALTYKDARGAWKDGGNEAYWVKETKYGMRYKCVTCGAEQLGTGGRNFHMTPCPLYVPPAPPPPPPMTYREAAKKFRKASEDCQDMYEADVLRGKAELLEDFGEGYLPKSVIEKNPEVLG